MHDARTVLARGPYACFNSWNIVETLDGRSRVEQPGIQGLIPHDNPE